MFLTITSFVRQQLTTAKRYYYIGIDLGMKTDYTVICMVEKTNNKLKLIHVKRPRLNGEYSDVLDYVKKLEHKFKVNAVYVDQTGVGEVFVQNARKLGVQGLNGVMMTQQKKMDLMTNLKQVMQQGLLKIPYDRQLMDELNAEISRLSESGKTLFSHRSGTHDDRLWALALAAYPARNSPTDYHPTILAGRRPGYNFREMGIAGVATMLLGLKRFMPRDPRLDNDPAPSGTVRSKCSFCGLLYFPIPGKGKASPCGHIDEKGNLTIKEQPTTVWRGSPGQIGNHDRSYWTAAGQH